MLLRRGEAWGALRYKDYARLTGYRQLVDQGYINPSDIRMTPYTFEGDGRRTGGRREYLTGYLWKIKPRNSDVHQYGRAGRARPGAAVGSDCSGSSSGRRPICTSTTSAISTASIPSNTVYARAHYRYPLNDDWAIRLGAEFTDQRAVGAAW